VIRLAATLASGAAYGLLFPPFSLDWLSWVVLVPLILAMRGLAPWRAGLLVGLWAWVGTVFIIAWLVPTLHEHFEQSYAFSVVFWLVFGVTALSPYYAAALGAWVQASRPLDAPARVLLFAACWVAAEYTRVHLGFESPWTRLGDAHVDSLYLRQIADLGGVYAVGAVVAAVNAALAEALFTAWRAHRGQRVAWRPAFLGLGLALAGVGLSLGYGFAYLQAPTADSRPMRVAIVQGNVDSELRWRSTTASRVMHRYGGLTRELLLDEGPLPDLIVWPENAIQTPLDDPTYGGILRRMAARGVPLLLGAPHSEDDGSGRAHYNSAHLLLSGGETLRYDKRRLLAFSETRPLSGFASFGSRGDLDSGQYTPGKSPGVFDVGDARIGVLICMEALYPELAREAVQMRADVLVNLSNDGWYRGRGGAEQHLSLVVFRAIETRTAVVRATTTGISAVIGPDGTRIAELDRGESGVLEARVPLRVGPIPIYAQVGDAFAGGCMLALIAFLARGAWPLVHAKLVRVTQSSRSSA
jgi:apolipoprotein N-acyltransferase